MKNKLLYASIVLLSSPLALAQSTPVGDGTAGGDTNQADQYVDTLTSGLGDTFGKIMAVLIPIMLAVTAIAWFRKFRNKA